MSINSIVQSINNAEIDAKTLEQCVNGLPNIKVTARLGQQYWTLATLNDKLNSVVLQTNNILKNMNAISEGALQRISDDAASVKQTLNEKLGEFDTAINAAAQAGAGDNGWTDLLVKTTVGGRTQAQKNSDFISVKDFGAVGDGVTDDTTAIQKALDSSKPLYVPSGKYLVKNPVLSNSKSISIFGENQYESKFIFNENATLKINGGNGGDEFNCNHVSIKGLGFIVNGVNTADGVIDISFNAGAGGTAQSLNICDVQIITSDAVSAFQRAINLKNTRNMYLDNIRILGDRGGNIAQSKHGIYLYGETGQNGEAFGAPVEIFIKNVQVFFVDTAIEMAGWVEGIYCTNMTAIACLNGFKAKSGFGVRPLVSIQSSHFNVQKTAIHLEDYAQSNISNNLIYTQLVNSSGGDFIGIYYKLNADKQSFADSIFSSNTFNGIRDGIKNGILIEDLTTEKHTNILVNSNKFLKCDSGIWIASGKNVVVADNNDFIGCSNKVSYSELSNNICLADSTTTGKKDFADGLVLAWGSSVITLDNIAQSVIPVNGVGGALLSAIICNGDFNVAPNAIIALDFNKSSSAGLKISASNLPPYVNTLRVNWQVLCYKAHTYS